ncbi:hypothetical protein EDD11_004710 [Mortierella claussenii]|nr:hypothetical protein EDD11_004710 [Mortierella claussenii]
MKLNQWKEFSQKLQNSDEPPPAAKSSRKRKQDPTRSLLAIEDLTKHQRIDQDIDESHSPDLKHQEEDSTSFIQHMKEGNGTRWSLVRHGSLDPKYDLPANQIARTQSEEDDCYSHDEEDDE